MSKGKFKLNYAAVGELLHSDGVANACLAAANKVAANAGNGYKVVSMPTRVIVVPGTKSAAQDNLDNNTLLKAAHR